MRQFYQNLVLRAGNQIDPDAPALGMPPIQLRAFMAWCLRGGLACCVAGHRYFGLGGIDRSCVDAAAWECGGSAVWL